MQQVQHFCLCWKHRCNWLSGIACLRVRNFSRPSCTRGSDALVTDSTLWNEKQSLEARLGQRVGWGTTAIFLAAQIFASSDRRWATKAQSLRWSTASSDSQIGMLIMRIWTCIDLRNAASSAFVVDFARFLHVFLCATCGGTNWTLRTSTKIFQLLNWQNHSTVCVVPMELSQKAVLSTSCFADAVCPSMKQNKKDCKCVVFQSSH